MNRKRSDGRRSYLGLAIPAMFAVLVSVADPAWSQDGGIRAAQHDGYGRMVIVSPTLVGYAAEIRGGRLEIQFDRPMNADFSRPIGRLGRYLSGVRVSNDRRRVSYGLKGEPGLLHFLLGSNIVIDLLDGGGVTRTAASTGGDRAVRAPLIGVRVGEHPTYSRIVFDWPRKVNYRVRQAGDTATLSFSRPARIDLGRLRRNMPKGASGVSSRTTQNGLEVEVTLRPGYGVKDLVAGTKVVVDLLRGQASLAARTPAPTATESPPEAPPEKATLKPTSLLPERPPSSPPPASVGPEGNAVSGPGQPATNEKPPSVAGQNEGGVSSLRFDFREPVAAAIFRRAGYLWTIFDKKTSPDIAALKAAGGGAIESATLVPHPEATILRLRTAEGVNPTPRRDGLSWILDFKKQPLSLRLAISTRNMVETPTGARILLPVSEPGYAVALRDPEVGDNLVVVPVMPLGNGFPAQLDYAQLSFLPTAQGIVISPLIDDLYVNSARQSVTISSPSVLHITEAPSEEEQVADLAQPEEVYSRVLDLSRWRRRTLVDFSSYRAKLSREVAETTGEERQSSRLELARMYFAYGLMPETLGVLKVMTSVDPEVVKVPELRTIRGGANLLMGRLDEAALDLRHPELGENDDAAFFRAVLESITEGPEPASLDIRRLKGVIKPYPKALKFPLGSRAAEVGIAVGDTYGAQEFIEELRLEELNASQTVKLRFLEGLVWEREGQTRKAIARLEEVERENDRSVRAHALRARINLLLKDEAIDPAEAIKELESLRYAWRGDDFEFNLLRDLADLYFAERDFRSGLRILRKTASNFGDHPAIDAVTGKMAQIFKSMYLEGGANALSPVTAIALFDEFKELTPTGDEGEEMVRRLADRLAAVDLLDRAKSLLENQLRFRLKGDKKARVGARLALFHLLDRQPQQALEALDQYGSADLPADLSRHRRHLRARALADLERSDEALQLLTDDESLDGLRLIADIQWQRRDWPRAALALRALMRAEGLTVRSRKPLQESQAQAILNLAVALSLSDNQRALSQLRNGFADAMRESSLRDAFDLIVAPRQDGLMDRQQVAERVQEGQKFQDFLSIYRSRLSDESASVLN